MNSDADQKKVVAVGDVDEVVFNVMEIENDQTIVNVPIKKRECRFPKEVPHYLKVHKLYSYSTCMVQCHAKYHLKMCNCTHHFMPYYSKQGYCDIDGLKCLTDNFEIFNRLRLLRDTEELRNICECLPSCTEPEYNIISHKKT
ncbi:unnamed protein product [Ceutorhynchus assimilis]|uniref:Uncharacterized protein n=1 Tax=Ceutorhynchus assimilis TaxID=467358 RepID=A0A9N9MKG0_9CUCU|nr:unnamed protein product [Ceutorhynchus assimilis]